MKKLNRENSFKESITLLGYIIDALGEFKNHYNKKFNFSKLMKFLKVSESEINDIISLILNFQEKFEDIFKNYRLEKKIIKNQIYILLKKRTISQKGRNETIESFCKQVRIRKAEAKLLSDVIYLFKFVKKGKGFDLQNKDTELLKNLKSLKKEHPYFFKKNHSLLIYPSKLGLKLGDTILSYNKSNKKINNLRIDNYNFVFD